MFIIIILTLILKSTNGLNLNNAKYWLTSCTLTGCSLTFNACLSCFGERGCTSCITSIRPECNQCINDIYNRDDLEIFEGVGYFICDSLDPFQEKACHLYCRGQYQQTGKCTRYTNLPICQCTNSDYNQLLPNSTISPAEQTTTEITTATLTTLTTTSRPVYNVTGSLKKRVSYIGFSNFFALPNSDLISIKEWIQGPKFEIWDSEKLTVKKSVDPILNASRHMFGLLSNGELVVGYREPKAFIIFDLDTLTEKRRIQTTEFFSCLHVLKNDDLVIGQYSPNSWTNTNFDIVIRDSQNGSIKKRLIGHSSHVWGIISLPNENLVSCSDDTTVKVWNPNTGVLIKSVTINYRAITALTYLKNINHIALGLPISLSDGNILLLNLENYRVTRSLYAHTENICFYSCLHALENGDLLSTGDSSIKIWNTKDGSLKSTLRSHQFPVGLLTFLPNGNLVSVSQTELAIWS